jgi:hypothetical protein
MKKGIKHFVLAPDEVAFWNEYLSDAKVPGKGKEFRSYGKSYKNWLFGHQTFTANFATWFRTKGIDKLAEKR